MTAGGGTYLLEDRELEVRAGDFIYMAPYCPQSFVAGDEPIRVPALQGRLARRFLSEGAARPFVQTAEPVHCAGRYPLHRARKGQTRREAGTQSKRSPPRRWLGRRSADHHVTQPAHARHHLTRRPPARRHPGAGAHGRAGARRRRPVHARFAQTAHGDIAAVGNTVLTCPTATAGCTDAQSAIGGTLNNNNWNMTLRRRRAARRPSTPRRPRSPLPGRRDRAVGGPVLGRRHERRHERRRGTERRRQGHGQAPGPGRRPTSRSPRRAGRRPHLQPRRRRATAPSAT